MELHANQRVMVCVDDDDPNTCGKSCKFLKQDGIGDACLCRMFNQKLTGSPKCNRCFSCLNLFGRATVISK